MRVVFMGTPDYAVPTLKKLIERHTVVSVVSQPDKPKGRGKKVAFTPVKEVAVEHNIPILQPLKVRDSEVVEEIRKFEPEVIVVVAFGQILPKELLDMPKYGCINVHGSLLPKYRGAAPIQWAVINGEKVTGNTTQFMAEGIDTGDILMKSENVIQSDDTYESLYYKMAETGADLLIKTLDELEKGNLKGEPQDNSQATYAPQLKKETGHIDWNKNSEDIVNLIRGLVPWPSPYSDYKGEILKIWKVQAWDKNYFDKQAGEIVEIIKNTGFIVKCGDKAVLVTEIQAQNGKRMNVADYLRGHSIEVGEILK